MLTYFDSSILLAILLDEKRKAEALRLWTGAGILPARTPRRFCLDHLRQRNGNPGNKTENERQ